MRTMKSGNASVLDTRENESPPLGKTVPIEASAAAPQMSIGRWVKDTDMEAQCASHARNQV